MIKNIILQILNKLVMKANKTNVVSEELGNGFVGNLDTSTEVQLKNIELEKENNAGVQRTLIAETTSEHKLQSIWRPIVAIMITATLLLQYPLIVILTLYMESKERLDYIIFNLQELNDLSIPILASVVGIIGGTRGVEKIIKALKK